MRWDAALASIIKWSNAVSSGRWPLARWRHSMTDRMRARSPRSRRRPRLGWSRWPATRPKSTAIRRNCGRRGSWQIMRASMHGRPGTPVSPSWSRARSARFSAERKSSRTRCAITWNRFERKMAEVLCVYREVQVLKKIAKSRQSGVSVAIVSYDEKPGIQAVATTSPDLPPVPGVHTTFARDYEYKRHGTLSLLAGIDLLTGKVHALVRDRHRSREFIEVLKLMDAAYPPQTAIKVILDNHSAHISRETRTWLATPPAGRFEFTFTPKHGSWLNLIEGFFSKFARSVLRHIRVSSKHELKQRIMAGIEDVNRHPVIHTWSYKLAEAA